MPCMGDRADHCCYIKGKPCPFLILNYVDETGHFRKWACGLRAKYGNWDDVLSDPDYQRVTKDAWAPGVNCKDWPDGVGWNGVSCSKCGANT